MNDHQTAQALALLQTLANMTTPFDHDMVVEFLDQNPEHKDLPLDELHDEIHADYPSDDAMEDASALWALIASARQILGSA